MGGRSGGSRDAIMRNLLAEHLDEAASRRTVAAITERGGDTRVADASDESDTNVEAKSRPAPVVQVQGAIKVASTASEPVPLPTPRAPLALVKVPAETQDKPAPAPAFDQWRDLIAIPCCHPGIG